VFAADLGVTSEGISAFSQEVTAEMFKNFARGGAAIRPRHIMSFWHELIADHSGEKILPIAHGKVVRILLCRIIQYPL